MAVFDSRVVEREIPSLGSVQGDDVGDAGRSGDDARLCVTWAAAVSTALIQAGGGQEARAGGGDGQAAGHAVQEHRRAVMLSISLNQWEQI